MSFSDSPRPYANGLPDKIFFYGKSRKICKGSERIKIEHRMAATMKHLSRSLPRIFWLRRFNIVTLRRFDYILKTAFDYAFMHELEAWMNKIDTDLKVDRKDWTVMRQLWKSFKTYTEGDVRSISQVNPGIEQAVAHENACGYHLTSGISDIMKLPFNAVNTMEMPQSSTFNHITTDRCFNFNNVPSNTATENGLQSCQPGRFNDTQTLGPNNIASMPMLHSESSLLSLRQHVNSQCTNQENWPLPTGFNMIADFNVRTNPMFDDLAALDPAEFNFEPFITASSSSSDKPDVICSTTYGVTCDRVRKSSDSVGTTPHDSVNLDYMPMAFDRDVSTIHAHTNSCNGTWTMTPNSIQ